MNTSSRSIARPLRPRSRRQASPLRPRPIPRADRKSTRLNSSHVSISYAVFCLKKKMLRIEADLLCEAVPQVATQTVFEGYQWAYYLLQVAIDVYVWADPARPPFVDIVRLCKQW